MCMICDRIRLWKEKQNPYFVYEFKHSIFVVGDHQYFDGYGLVLYKDHISDITNLPFSIQKEYFGEVMIAGKVLQKTFSPYRMNYSCLGNLEEHVHFHLFPRYEEELQLATKKNPWNCSEKFKDFKIDHEQSVHLADKLRMAVNEVVRDS